MRNHLNRSLGIDGFRAAALHSKPLSFLSHPSPECLCRTARSSAIPNATEYVFVYESEDKCPEWMVKNLATVSSKATNANVGDIEETGPVKEIGNNKNSAEEFENVESSSADEELDITD